VLARLARELAGVSRQHAREDRRLAAAELGHLDGIAVDERQGVLAQPVLDGVASGFGALEKSPAQPEDEHEHRGRQRKGQRRELKCI
jgi:hypothetical protein